MIILLLEGVFLKSISAVFCVFMTFIRFFSFLRCISSICTVLLSENLRIVVNFITRRLWLILKIQYQEVFTGVCIIAFTAFLYLVIAIRVASTSILGILEVFMILIVCILYERLVLLIECVLHLAVFLVIRGRFRESIGEQQAFLLEADKVLKDPLFFLLFLGFFILDVVFLFSASLVFIDVSMELLT